MHRSVWLVCLFFLALLPTSLGLQGCDCEGGQVNSADFPRLRVSPSPVIFDAVPVGQKRLKTVTLKNEGDQPLDLTKLEVLHESGSSKAYRLSKGKEMPFTMDPGSKLTLEVEYAPTKAGSARGILRITSNARNAGTDGALDVKLRSVDIAAAIEATPNPVDFGSVKKGVSKTKKVTVSNLGQAELTITGLQFVSNKDKSFVLVKPWKGTQKLAPGKSLSLEIKYTPKASLADEKLLVLNNSALPKYEIRLLGKLAAPQMVLIPEKLVFNEVGRDAKGVKTFTIRNDGPLPLTISKIAMKKGSSENYKVINLPKLPFTLATKKEQKIQVEFHAKGDFKEKGAVEVSGNDPNRPKGAVQLSAQPLACDLQATPSSVIFRKPGTLDVTVVNKGTKACQYKNAGISVFAGGNKDFVFAFSPPKAQDIRPNGYLSFKVKYAGAGKNIAKGELVLDTPNAKPAQLRVPLLFNPNYSPDCQLEASPSTMQFGFVSVGKSKSLALTLTNTGFSDCKIKLVLFDINPDGAFTLTSFAQGKTIAPGGKLAINVNYTPARKIPYSGNLKIGSNDPKTPTLNVKLVGLSGQPCLEVQPDPMSFGSSKIRCSAREVVDLVNLCTSPIRITGVKVKTNSSTNEFKVVSPPSFPKSLGFSQYLRIKLAYTPTNLGSDQGTLEILSSAPGQSPYLLPMVGKGVSSNEQKDTFKQSNTPKVDILFVIDDSQSMEDEQKSLGTNFASFINWASKLQVDYNIAVTTTDTDCRKKGGRYRADSSGVCKRQGRPDIPLAGCIRGTPKVMTKNTPNLTAVFRRNVAVGLRGSGNEKGIEASYLALTSDRLSGCNKVGFYRKDAALSLIYVSDEKDSSTQQLDFYIKYFQSLKGSKTPDKVRASAIGPTALSTCKNNGKNCKYYDMSRRMGGVYSHIASTNWSQTLSQLGFVSFGYRSQFFLSRPAEPNSIQVKVNGKVVRKSASGGWTYDPSNNSINFASSVIPPANATIEVTYKTICIPAP